MRHCKLGHTAKIMITQDIQLISHQLYLDGSFLLTTKLVLSLGRPQFNSSIMLVNSQLVCLPPKLGFLGCHENSDPENSDTRPQTLRTRELTPQKLRPLDLLIYIKKRFQLISIFMVTQCSWATTRKKRDIYLLRFIAVASIKQC